MNSLFGETFDIDISKPPVKSLVAKLTPQHNADVAVEKALKSKRIPLADRLSIIKETVDKILGKQKENVIVIRDTAAFSDYIDKAIAAGRIAIDTETDNSTDTVQCLLMGLCLYVPGEKQAYIPINHTDLQGNRLADQLTEEDCRFALQRIVDAGIFKVFHNGKFDYEVLKTTCHIEVAPDWDTMIAAWLIDENKYSLSHASLKYLYTTLIDTEQNKYDIGSLFEHIPYKYVDPEVFALYAATDSLMTDKVYLWEKPFFEKPENAKLKQLFETIEMPIVKITGDMELQGVAIDAELGKRLEEKYNKKLAAIDTDIEKELNKLTAIINAWRLTKEANEKTRTYQPKKSKLSDKDIEEKFPYVDDKVNKRYRIGKTLAEQLPAEINLASPAQLAILFYDVLKVPSVSKKAPRGTGKDELKAINEKLIEFLPKDRRTVEILDDTDEQEESFDTSPQELIKASKSHELYTEYKAAATICNLLLERRGLAKLLTTYIETIPKLASHWYDGRVRIKFNSAGTNTGRYASGGKWHWLEDDQEVTTSGINGQNIPSRGDGKIVRLLFKADTKFHQVFSEDNYYTVPETDEVETIDGWKKVQDLSVGDTVIGQDTKDIISRIDKINNNYLLYI